MSNKRERRIFNSASVSPDKCIFCKIIERKLPSYLIYEDKEYIAFLDTAPFALGHTLVSPKKHGETVWDMSEAEIGELFMLASKISKAVVSAMMADGFRFVQNNGEAANQVVPHVHIHVIPVMLADKGRFMDRKRPSPDEMTRVADRIREALSSISK